MKSKILCRIVGIMLGLAAIVAAIFAGFLGIGALSFFGLGLAVAAVVVYE